MELVLEIVPTKEKQLTSTLVPNSNLISIVLIVFFQFYFSISKLERGSKKEPYKERKKREFIFSRKGDNMKNRTDSFSSLGYWPSAGSLGFNTEILATNPRNRCIAFFWKGSVCELFISRIGWIQPTVLFSLKLRKKKGASSRELLMTQFSNHIEEP